MAKHFEKKNVYLKFLFGINILKENVEYIYIFF